MRGPRPPQVIYRYFLGGFYGWGGFYQPVAPDAAHPSAAMQTGLERRKAPRVDPRKQDQTEESAEEVQDVSSAGRERTVSLGDAMSWPNELTIATSSTIPAMETAGPAQATDLAGVTAEIPEVSEVEPATPSRLSKRELILARARTNARTPLPQSILHTEEKRREEEKKLAQEREEEERVRTSVRERLWKMIGSKWS